MPRASSFVLALLGCLASASAQQPDQAKERLKVTVAGKVIGVAAVRARVTLWHSDMERNSVDPLAETFADADGMFAFRDVPWFEKQEWGFHSTTIVAKAGDLVGMIEVRGDKQPIDELEIEVKPGLELRGRLFDEVSGEAIGGAWIWPATFGERDNQFKTPLVWLTSPLLPWRAETATNGEFVLRGVPDIQPISMVAGGPNHARRWVKVEDPAEPLDEAMKLGCRISGKVLMPDGSPAGRVRVQASGVGIGYGITHTDDHGHYTLTSLSADTYKVWAEVADLTVIAVTGIAVVAGETAEDRTVQLTEGGFIVGRIVDAETGKPIVPGPHTDVAMYGPARGDGGACECTPVRADGTFRIRAPAGRNRIYLRAAMGWSEPSEFVEVIEGQEKEVVWKVSKGKPRRRGRR